MASDNTNAEEGIQTAGDVDIQEVVILKANNEELDIRTLVTEINIYEDIFKPGLYGKILLVDAANIVGKFPIIGDEYIRLKIKTPSIQQHIYKTFKVYSITNRMMLRDTGMQSYILHFCSTELFIDMLAPVYRTFTGSMFDVVSKIYSENLAIPRNTGEAGDESPLVVIGDPDNNVTFTSPGWHPIHCLNWLAARATTRAYKSPSFLFYETTQGFYFANMEAIIDNAVTTKEIYREYMHMANKITGESADGRYVRDIDKDYKKVESLEIVETFNGFNNTLNGYYANRLITLDLLTKKYETFDYDHVSNYKDYKHLEDIAGSSKAPFNDDALRAPASYVRFYPRHEKLFNNAPDNVSDIIEKTLPQRISVLQELGNFKLIITVPGRTDAEVGNVIYLSYPDARPRDESDKTDNGEDPLFSGYYLITAIRHKVTLIKHMMIMEIVKESYRDTKGNTA
jgi:hypothetical protein